VAVEGWSPFIPTDEDNSSLPVGAITYTFENKGKQEEKAVFSFNTENFMNPKRFMQPPNHQGHIRKMKNGLILSREGTENEPWREGEFAIFTDEDKTVGDYCWFRGSWWDPLTMAWETIKKGTLKEREPVEKDAPGASLFVPFSLKPGEKKSIRVKMAW